SRQFAVEIDGAHVGDEAASGQPEQAYHWDGAVVNKQHKVRVGARTLGAHTPVQYPWTARVAADKCPRFVPQNATASCNGHGVVKVSWDAVEGAAKYKLDNLAYEGPGGADGDRRYAVAQRNEGQTYTFRAAAHTAGDWGGWSNTATTTCDPLDPAEPGHPDWRSPNGERESGCVQGVCVNRWVNPPLARYVLDAATAFGSGRDNCTPTVRNAANTGWTRTCTIYWTEHLDVEVDDDKVLEYFQHGKGRAHGADEPHLHKTADGRASVEAHRHCGDHTTDGTCSDESDIPDLPWHPPLPKPGDTWWDNALEENGASIIVGTAGFAALGYVLARGGGTVGSTLGPVGTVVGAVLGFAVGMGIAWLNSRDDDVTLSISGFTECLAPPWLSATDAKWAKQTATVSETLEENGYTTIISNKIDHCVETVG
ncbi:MAG: hypothetical protein OXE45_04690, partial [bacterium]|nr:hypothetical protein [bacterium]